VGYAVESEGEERRAGGGSAHALMKSEQVTRVPGIALLIPAEGPLRGRLRTLHIPIAARALHHGIQ